MFSIPFVQTLIDMQFVHDGATDILRDRIIELSNHCVREGLFESIEVSLQKQAYVLLPKSLLPVAVHNQVRGEMNELLFEENLAPFQMEFVGSSATRLSAMVDVLSQLTLSRENEFKAPVIIAWRMDEIFAQLIGCKPVIGAEVRNALVRLQQKCTGGQLYIILPDEEEAFYHAEKAGSFDTIGERRAQAREALQMVIRMAKEMKILVNPTGVLWRSLASKRATKGEIAYGQVLDRCIRAKGITMANLPFKGIDHARRLQVDPDTVAMISEAEKRYSHCMREAGAAREAGTGPEASNIHITCSPRTAILATRNRRQAETGGKRQLATHKHETQKQ